MTGGNRPITVNGANALSGATILTGSIIETPYQVGGVISLGSLSNLEIEPNFKAKLEFDQDGNLKVTVIRGWATARTKKNLKANRLQFRFDQDWEFRKCAFRLWNGENEHRTNTYSPGSAPNCARLLRKSGVRLHLRRAYGRAAER